MKTPQRSATRLKTLKEIRFQNQKQLFFDDLQDAIQAELSQQEKEYLIDYMLALRYKQNRLTSQKLLSSHKKFILLQNCNSNPQSQKYESPLICINQKLFQKTKTTQRVQVLQQTEHKKSKPKIKNKISIVQIQEKQNNKQSVDKMKQRNSSLSLKPKKRYYYDNKTKRKLINMCPTIKERQKTIHLQQKQLLANSTVSFKYNSFLQQIFVKPKSATPSLNFQNNSFTDAAIRNITSQSLQKLQKTHDKASTIRRMTQESIFRRKRIIYQSNI